MTSPVRPLHAYLFLLTITAALGLAVPLYAQYTIGGASQIPQIPTLEQAPHLWYRFFQDGSWHYRVIGADTVDINYVSPAYEFRMLYDSLCVVTYLVTEYRHNGRLLRLPKWTDRRIVNAPPYLLSYNSTTESFLCRSGDTLSLYRELSWRNPLTSVQDTGNYYALDSLDYAVELVRLRDSSRVALVDSIGALPSYVPGRPRIHSASPVMALVKYPIPRHLDGEPAFMRVRLYHRGAGQYYFTRVDQTTVELSKSLSDSSCLWYVDMFGEGSPFYKVQLLEMMHTGTYALPYLDVRMESTTPRHAVITFETFKSGKTTIGIYNAAGRAVYYPHMTSLTNGRAQLEYLFDCPGTFFVGLLVDNQIIATRKVFVPR